MKKVNVDDLKEGMVAEQTLCDSRGTVLLSAGMTLTSTIIKRLRRFNVNIVSVQDDDDESNGSVQEIAQHAIENLVDKLHNDRTVNVMKNIKRIKEIMLLVLEKPSVQRLLSICAKDETLYNHVLRTAILCTNLGINSGYNLTKLELLATSATLHDCGLEKYDEHDKEHPLAGFIQLREDLSLDMVVALTCLQHHE